MFERSDKYLGIGCLALGVLGYVSAAQWTVRISTDPAGPAAVPKILCVAFMALGVIMLLGSIFMAKKRYAEGEREKNRESGKAGLVTAGLLLGVCLIYLIILPYIGYLLATPLLIAGILLAVRVRKVKTIVLVSVLATLVLFALFFMLLKVNLPLGFMKDFINGLGLRW